MNAAIASVTYTETVDGEMPRERPVQRVNMDVSTMNAMLQSKLLSDRQKRAMLFAQFPGLAEVLAEPDPEPDPVAEGIDLPPPEEPDFICPDGFYYDWQARLYFPLPPPQTPPHPETLMGRLPSAKPAA
jgi:hypothetical protein